MARHPSLSDDERGRRRGHAGQRAPAAPTGLQRRADPLWREAPYASFKPDRLAPPAGGLWRPLLGPSLMV